MSEEMSEQRQPSAGRVDYVAPAIKREGTVAQLTQSGPPGPGPYDGQAYTVAHSG